MPLTIPEHETMADQQIHIVYVYYKLPTDHREAFLQASRQLHQRLLTDYDISAELQKRPTLDVNGQETWMEVYTLYSDAPEVFLQALEACTPMVDGDAGFLVPERHVEIFESIW